MEKDKWAWDKDNVEVLLHPALITIIRQWRVQAFPTEKDYIQAQHIIYKTIIEPFWKKQSKKTSAMQMLQLNLDLLTIVLKDLKTQYEREKKIKFNNMIDFVMHLLQETNRPRFSSISLN